MRQKSGGARQKLWDILRAATEPCDVLDIYQKLGVTTNTLRPYINALAARGYIDVVEQKYDGPSLVRMLELVRNTGPRAPSWTAATDAFRDWNIDPAMSGDELRKLIRATGLSDAEWLKKHNMSPTNSSRLRDMMSGKRPVSEAIADAAQGVSND